MQVIWLVVYWWGVLPVLYLFFFGIVGGVQPERIATLLLALTASVVGAVWATRVARMHVGNTIFVKGTTTIRVIAVAWLAIGFALIIVPIVSVVFGIEFTEDGTVLGFVSTVGSVSLLALVGPGYSEYREARDAAVRTEIAPATLTPPTPEPTPVP